MAQLTTTAIITAQDRLTGPLSAMASRVQAIQGRFSGGVARMGRASAGLGIGAMGGVYGLNMLLDKAQEFNTKIFGIGVAGLPEAMGADGKIDLSKPKAEMEGVTKSAMQMSRELGMSVTDIAGIGETLRKAGMGAENLDAITRAAATLSKTDLETPASAMADFLHTITVIQKQNAGESFGDFINRQADMVYAAAATTKLSVGSMMDGMRQFQTIGAGMGMKTEEMLALMMGGAQRGFNASELGTALKSDMVRAVKPTAEGQAVLNRILGAQGKNMSSFAKLEPLDPTRAISNLSRATGLNFTDAASAKLKKQIGRELTKAQAEGYTMSDAFIDHLTKRISTFKGVNDAEGIQGIRNAVINSIAAPSGGFKFTELFRALVEGGATEADLAAVFEGRQLARNKAFVEMFKKNGGNASEYDQMVQLLRRQSGQGLDAVNTLWSTSMLGNVTAMKSAIERLGITLANNQGLQKFVSWIERAADALSKVNPEIVKFGIQALGFGMIAGPLSNLARGMWGVGAAAVAVYPLIGRFMAMPFLALATRSAAAATALSGMALRAVMLGTGFKTLLAGSRATGVLASIATGVARIARFAGPLALVAGAWEVFQHWDSIVGVFDQIAGSGSVTAFMDAMTRLYNAVAPIGTAMSNMVDALFRLLGFDTSGSIIVKSITGLIDMFTWLLNTISAVIEKFNQWTGISSGENGPQAAAGGQTSPGASITPIGSTSPPAVNLNPPSWFDSLGGMITSAIKQGFSNIQITGPGTAAGPGFAPRGAATAPPPRTQNGGQHNGGN